MPDFKGPVGERRGPGPGGSDEQDAEGAARRNRPEEPAGETSEAAEGDIITRLERLAELKNQGELTDAEYEQRKAKLLAD